MIEQTLEVLEFPASYAQRRLWLLDQLDPGAPPYNVPTATRLSGHLDVTALERALAEVVRRHESLRTTFAARAGEPVQRIHPHSDAPALLTTDLRHLGAQVREPEARRLAAEEARAPFDLTRGPLWRAHLLRLDTTEYVLLLTLHHIVTDGWSMGVLFNELATLYAAYAAGTESPLAELPIQYADYAVWQHEQAGGA
ncbi:MAG TPA: condensation domain-containing protein, partial [Pyrinomonadaceae bacterium]